MKTFSKFGTACTNSSDLTINLWAMFYSWNVENKFKHELFMSDWILERKYLGSPKLKMIVFTKQRTDRILGFIDPNLQEKLCRKIEKKSNL